MLVPLANSLHDLILDPLWRLSQREGGRDVTEMERFRVEDVFGRPRMCGVGSHERRVCPPR